MGTGIEFRRDMRKNRFNVFRNTMFIGRIQYYKKPYVDIDKDDWYFFPITDIDEIKFSLDELKQISDFMLLKSKEIL